MSALLKDVRLRRLVKTEDNIPTRGRCLTKLQLTIHT